MRVLDRPFIGSTERVTIDADARTETARRPGVVDTLLTALSSARPGRGD